MKTWQDVNAALHDALADGWLVDYRGQLPRHATRRFDRRVSPEDILGLCTHHSGSVNQDPRETARYHVSPNNHVSVGGCPGLLYTFVISQTIYPDKVLLCNDLEAICWSQGKGTEGRWEWSGDENRHLHSVLVMGDFGESFRAGRSGDPTLSQVERWETLVQWEAETFDIQPHGLFGHYHFGKRDCPGRYLRQRLEGLREGDPDKGLYDDEQWQQALLRWNSNCLPLYGADGAWGTESRQALVAFERAHKHAVDGVQDPFTELLLMRKYPEETR